MMSSKESFQCFNFLTVIEKGDIRKGDEFMRENVNKGVKLKKDDRIMFERYLDDYFIPFWLQQRMKNMYTYTDN